MSAKKVNKTVIELFIFVATLFVLLLSALNIKNYLAPKKTVKVLGAETITDPETSSGQRFWQDFLKNNPGYIPGWIEIGRTDKVKEIDPNYLTP